MKYIQHPLISRDKLEERKYQLAIAMRALDGNTMVVLPTGMGKTAVAVLAAASRLHNTGGKILMMAPTKPLVDQHLRFFRQFLNLPGADDSSFVMFTGETAIQEREASWKTASVIFATPQVIKNDLLAGRYDLSEVSLLIVDECHRAVGNYAYVFIAQEYKKTAHNPLLLAMTASPGSDLGKVEEVCSGLGIEIIETRTEDDDDVRPYIHEKEVQYIGVDLPGPLADALAILNRLMDARLDKLKKMGFHAPARSQLSMKQLNLLNSSIQRRIRNHDASAYTAASIYAECMKLRHAIAITESQGSEALKQYLGRLSAEAASKKTTKASRRLVHDPLFQELISATESWEDELHPKLDLVLNLVRIQLNAYPESRIIVFATYRDTVGLLVKYLNESGIDCERFVGQAARDSEKGLSQKKQLEALDKFRTGEFRVLVATSVGEEGLDVPSTDMVIFYEAVPSEIRSIQRKGRTGRHGTGRIIVLVTKGTSDEAFRYVSQSRERAMVKGMATLRSQSASPDTGGYQASIEAFIPEGPVIVVDDRETSSKVVEYLHSSGADITIRRLEHGDYAIGDRILVERKTTRDFMDTLVNRDLFGQIREISASATRPVLIVEGDEDIYSIRNIHPNAVKGALVALSIDLGVSVFFTRTSQETAELLYILGKREEGGRSERALHPHKTYRSMREHQEYILSAVPGIGIRQARLLLEHFGTLQNVINADKDELKKITGIGEKSAGTIWELARRKYS